MAYRPSTISTKPSTFFDLVDAALHVKIGFGHLVVFAVEDFLETADGVRHRDLFSRPAGEHFGHAEGLAQEPLNFPGAEDADLVVGGKLVHAENRDDVLQVLVALQHALNT